MCCVFVVVVLRVGEERGGEGEGGAEREEEKRTWECVCEKVSGCMNKHFFINVYTYRRGLPCEDLTEEERPQ